jgi:hypothetical protein
VSSEAATTARSIVFSPSWSRAQRYILRFLVCYFAVYAPVILSGLGLLGLPLNWYDGLWGSTVRLVSDLLGLKEGGYAGYGQESSGSFQAAQAVLYGILAIGMVVIWSRKVTDSVEDDYKVYHWFRIGLRYVLAYAALHFAVVALLRFQFTDLTPENLITPAGDMKPAELLWAFFGWSWIFTTFLAAAELLSGVLLLRRRTTLLGALLMGSILSNVVILNFTFDVPGKSIAPHLLVIVGLLLLPDLKRVFDVHFLGRSVPPADLGYSVPAEPFLKRNHGRVKALMILLMIASPAYLIYKTRGYLIFHTKHTLSALYEVPKFVRDSTVHPPIIGDSVRWRRVVIAEKGDFLHVQLANNKWQSFTMKVDTAKKKIALSAPSPSEWRAKKLESNWGGETPLPDTVTYAKAGSGDLQLVGSIASHKMDISLKPVDISKFKFFGVH